MRALLEGANDPFAFPTAKRNKYGNVPVVVEGRRIPSKAQAAHEQELKLKTAHGLILGWIPEVSFLLPGGGRIRLDAVVNEPTSYPCPQCQHQIVIPTLVLEDVKGMITPAWEVKRRALEAALGVTVRIIRQD